MTAAGTPPPAAPSAPAPARAVRWFGRWQLLRLLGKSERTMAWRVADPTSGHELMLVLPRVQPADAAALETWQLAVRQASRLSHPQLAAVVDSGVQDGWPFVAYDPRQDATLVERLPAGGLPGLDAAALMRQLLQGLAFAHEGGVAHHDLQPFLVLVSDGGSLRLAGLAVAAESAWRDAPAGEGASLSGQRAAAERDVVAAGVLLHTLLVGGAGALDEPDVGKVVDRLLPWAGERARDIVRLPWNTGQRIAEPLRTITNRATDRQERQRYRNARTLWRALDGWMQAESGAEAGPLALLADRLRTAGVLPSSPGASARAARLAMMESQRTHELAEVVLDDFALSFEMIRLANGAQARAAGSGAVLTVRRAIAMLGLDGVRRAALALRAWPGPLDEHGARRLERLVERVRRAGRTALALRPAGYDGEVVYLVTLLQNLGRLVVHYHFADEAQQIERLQQSAPSPREGEPDEPGMSEEAASFAVLGADIDGIGLAVARHWQLGDELSALMRRLPLATPPRHADDDAEVLRAVASCANEAVDAASLPAAKAGAALQRVVQRYGRLLGIGLRDLHEALKGEARITEPAPLTMPAPLDGPVGRADDAGGLRRAASLRQGAAP